MKQSEKIEVSQETFDGYKITQVCNKTFHSEHRFGSKRSLIVHGSTIATTGTNKNNLTQDLSQRAFVSFLGGFNRNLYKALNQNPALQELKIEFSGDSKGKNTELWEKMHIGHFFYTVDADSAYWQIGRKIGYVPNGMYLRYLNQDEYKHAKRLCFSFLARENKMIYYHPESSGKHMIHEVVCDISPLQRVFDNVRNELYRIMAEARAGVDVLEWNIDGVSVFADCLDMVRSRLKAAGILYKTVPCRKVSDTEYSYGGGIIKKFT